MLSTDDISLKEIICMATVSGGTHEPNQHIDRPDAVVVDRSTDVVYEETDIDVGRYEELGQRDSTSRPVYQQLQLNKRPKRR